MHSHYNKVNRKLAVNSHLKFASNPKIWNRKSNCLEIRIYQRCKVHDQPWGFYCPPKPNFPLLAINSVLSHFQTSPERHSQAFWKTFLAQHSKASVDVDGVGKCRRASRAEWRESKRWPRGLRPKKPAFRFNFSPHISQPISRSIVVCTVILLMMNCSLYCPSKWLIYYTCPRLLLYIGCSIDVLHKTVKYL